MLLFIGLAGTISYWSEIALSIRKETVEGY